MKVSELFEHDYEDLDKLFVQYYAETAFGNNIHRKEYYKCIESMMQKYPQYVYSGEMFRTVQIHQNKFKEFTNIEDILQFIRSETNRKQATMQSWSSTKDGVERYYNFTKTKINVSVFLTQIATGFYVPEYSKHHGVQVSDRKIGNIPHNFLRASEKVHEVLAPENQTVSIQYFKYRDHVETDISRIIDRF